jgi:hypothetical protein
MKIPISEFSFIQLFEPSLKNIIEIQEETFALLADSSILRRNNVEMLKNCLKPPHYSIGAYYNGILAGFAILFFPEQDDENLAVKLKSIDTSTMKSANYKLCIIREKYRGNHLQVKLGELLEQYSIEKDVDVLCATVSPANKHSMDNVIKLGFLYDSTLTKYGLTRNLYYKLL